MSQANRDQARYTLVGPGQPCWQQLGSRRRSAANGMQRQMRINRLRDESSGRNPWPGTPPGPRSREVAVSPCGPPCRGSRVARARPRPMNLFNFSFGSAESFASRSSSRRSDSAWERGRFAVHPRYRHPPDSTTPEQATPPERADQEHGTHNPTRHVATQSDSKVHPATQSTTEQYGNARPGSSRPQTTSATTANMSGHQPDDRSCTQCPIQWRY